MNALPPIPPLRNFEFKGKSFMLHDGKVTTGVHDSMGMLLFVVPPLLTDELIEVALHAYFEGRQHGKEDEQQRIIDLINGESE
jgi:hypothetical protein